VVVVMIGSLWASFVGLGLRDDNGLEPIRDRDRDLNRGTEGCCSRLNS
jgi:hypothetical protein